MWSRYATVWSHHYINRRENQIYLSESENQSLVEDLRMSLELPVGAKWLLGSIGTMTHLLESRWYTHLGINNPIFETDMNDATTFSNPLHAPPWTTLHNISSETRRLLLNPHLCVSSFHNNWSRVAVIRRVLSGWWFVKCFVSAENHQEGDLKSSRYIPYKISSDKYITRYIWPYQYRLWVHLPLEVGRCGLLNAKDIQA